MKKEEGKAFDLNTEKTTQKVLEVGTSTNETKIDDRDVFICMDINAISGSCPSRRSG